MAARRLVADPRPGEDDTATTVRELLPRTPEPKQSRSPSGIHGARRVPRRSEPSATQEPSETTEPSQDSTPVTSGADSAAEFVSDYYTFLPEDTDASWSMLSPELQDQLGRGTFDGFWATIDDVRVDGSESVDDGLVEVTLTYVTDGQVASRRPDSCRSSRPTTAT